MLLDDIDNSSGFHVYRIAYSADDVIFQIWRDGILVATNLAPAKDTVYKVLGFGDGSSTGSGAGMIDYFRWDATGAYAPDAILVRPGDANGDGFVDVDDAAILAQHWLAGSADWGMGDFNEDGVVNDLDAALMAANWGAGSASASVPEPGAAIVLLSAVLAVATAIMLRKR